MKVIDSMWFNTPQGSYGLVIGENDMGERKLYSGVAEGLDQQADEQAILSWGNKANLGMMEGLIAKTRKVNATEVLDALRGQHQAIDRLFAELIKRDADFFPSKSGQPWEAAQKGNALVKKLSV